jgi:hypothetical protein
LSSKDDYELEINAKNANAVRVQNGKSGGGGLCGQGSKWNFSTPSWFTHFYIPFLIQKNRFITINGNGASAMKSFVPKLPKMFNIFLLLILW